MGRRHVTPTFLPRSAFLLWSTLHVPTPCQGSVRNARHNPWQPTAPATKLGEGPAFRRGAWFRLGGGNRPGLEGAGVGGLFVRVRRKGQRRRCCDCFQQFPDPTRRFRPAPPPKRSRPKAPPSLPRPRPALPRPRPSAAARAVSMPRPRPAPAAPLWTLGTPGGRSSPLARRSQPRPSRGWDGA